MFQILVKAFRDRNGVTVLASVERLSCSHRCPCRQTRAKGEQFLRNQPAFDFGFFFSDWEHASAVDG
jgi:hypothetical protein